MHFSAVWLGGSTENIVDGALYNAQKVTVDRIFHDDMLFQARRLGACETENDVGWLASRE